ncbi:MAG: TIGR04222 domain-containing membrane protein [Gemmataceae bacterium]
MTPARSQLLRDLEAFDIDGGELALPFAARLAREQGWSRSRAEQVVREYKRFLFLAVGPDGPQCPSADVDAAWHLHLIYTRSYWVRLCGEVLGTPLHHDPTPGGAEAIQHYHKLYANTLAVYTATFGHAPPPAVWPPVKVRFASLVAGTPPARWRMPRMLLQRILRVAGVIVVCGLGTGCDQTMNPFQWNGTDFFYALIPALLAAIVVGVMAQDALALPKPLPGDEEQELPWEQTAILAGGSDQLLLTGLSRLVADGVIRIEDKSIQSVDGTSENSPERTAIERLILSHLPLDREAWEPLKSAVAFQSAPMQQQLVDEGYLMTPQQKRCTWIVGLAPLLAVFGLLGLPRLIMGLSAEKPVLYLILVLAVGLILGLMIVFGGLTSRSRRGEVVLRGLQSRYDPDEFHISMAVALFGSVALTGTALLALREWHTFVITPIGNSSTGDGGGSGGDSGCGSGCGGCGGGD